MSFPLSRLMSTGTATYGVYALAQPRHLGTALDPRHAEDYDLLAEMFGVRDLVIGSVGMLGRSERTVTTAMRIRILCDIGDGIVLARRAKDDQTRATILAITLGWAALNFVALRVDRRRAKKTA